MSVEPLRVDVLGPIRAWRGSREIDLGPAKQRTIFALLAVHLNQPVPVAQLASRVWSDSPPDKAAGLLHTYISRLRRLLEPGVPARTRTNLIRLTPRGYQLGGDPALVDAHSALALADRAARLLDGAEWERAFDLLGDAVGIWEKAGTSELANLVPDDPAVQFMRRRYVDTALQFLRIGLAHDRTVMMLPLAERLARGEPLNEAIQACYLRCLARTGQRAAALDWYADLRAWLRTDLGVSPSDELADEYQRLLAEPDEPPADAAPVSRPRADPLTWRGSGPPAEEPVGRTGEIAAIRHAVSRQRLVTLVGAPGCGKSALARAALRGDPPVSAGGVSVVDLHDAETESDIRQRLVDVLSGFAPSGGDWRAMLGALAGRTMLLLFDNADRVTEECARVTDEILRFCPSVVVVVTSREVLRLPYESVLPVLPLPAPDPGDASEPARLARVPAVELFVHRARQAWAGFELNGDTARATAVICHRLDGLPLGLESAAASLRTTDLDRVAELVAEGELRFGAPWRGTRPGASSLYDAIRWSYDQLDSLEQRCLSTVAQLGPVFTPRAAVRAWRRDHPAAGSQLSALLASLTDRSLVYVERGDGDFRYRILEPIRTFVSEREPVRARSLSA
ncbi:winged helix-turn-helix domain-containing protein [Actinoplanes bogorensis]|uniref:Winged helix-turn-helix domain-containing protein n=1 Tax=Paractinoplanes bogorensis TaxID=1610840 RepID=A0ABS5YX05_9ACTN|nr:BTAD domain-containing putative transcriptional regulator [Actinoplanes bogorensis]MBU2667263.1 winged helix-turn-helix domain-containing protein [Actinoplanes bogorensis]